ncbi:hypothetical protein C8R45DRAFT_1098968 [Mycena sanguinolenta]|nr:hypothetical protein C8R45DRAFT_1098968 [Mycena sanguinolenta]
MHLAPVVLALIAAAHPSAAFPSSYFDGPTARLVNRTIVGFDPAQLIDVTGAHAFQPPGAGDFRGPLFGLGIDFATAAGALALFGADLLAPGLPFSIGGPPPPSLLTGLLGGIVGKFYGAPTGLSGTHNQFETDSSPTRGDYYQFNGDNHHLQLPYFQALYDLPPAGPSANYDLDILFQFRQTRFQQSVSQNPYFFYGPLEMASYSQNLIVSGGVHSFIARVFSNHSAEFPDGFLNGEILKSIYAITTAPDGTLQYTPGHEQIPVNWYPPLPSRPYPDTLAIGGNVNGVNSFAPIDIGNLTEGVYNAETLLEGDNAACFVYQVLQILVPDALNGLASFVDVIVTDILSVTGPLLAQLTCPQLNTLDTSLFEQYPGYSHTSHPV